MYANFFAAPTSLLLGAITGLVFGFLLQRGGVTRYNVIVSQFLFKDFTVLKTMLTAILVGAVGIYAMKHAGIIQSLHIKPVAVAMNAIGGGIFGVGMVLLGYCPGTALAAVGQGSKDAIVGIAGAVVGAGVYAEAFPFITQLIGNLGSGGKVTLPELTRVSPWVWIVGLAVVSAALFFLIESIERKRAATPNS